jgi:hypothetical protein
MGRCASHVRGLRMATVDSILRHVGTTYICGYMGEHDGAPLGLMVACTAIRRRACCHAAHNGSRVAQCKVCAWCRVLPTQTLSGQAGSSWALGQPHGAGWCTGFTWRVRRQREEQVSMSARTCSDHLRKFRRVGNHLQLSFDTFCPCWLGRVDVRDRCSCPQPPFKVEALTQMQSIAPSGLQTIAGHRDVWTLT